MDDQRIGAIIRLLRIRRNWRQSDLARAAGVSTATISRLERGHFEHLSLATLRAVAAALDVRLELLARWRGGDLDRLVNARHSAMHEAVARMFAELPAWSVRPEVSFAVYSERGVVDLLAWHAATRTVLVVELKTEIVDVQEMMGTLDKKRRLGFKIARDQGWTPVQLGVWLLVAESTTNRARVRAHETVLRAAYPASSVEMRHWLRAPAGRIAALSFLDAGGWSRSGGRGRRTGGVASGGAGGRTGRGAVTGRSATAAGDWAVGGGGGRSRRGARGLASRLEGGRESGAVALQEASSVGPRGSTGLPAPSSTNLRDGPGPRESDGTGPLPPSSVARRDSGGRPAPSSVAPLPPSSVARRPQILRNDHGGNRMQDFAPRKRVRLPKATTPDAADP
jgi:transcriptional regulator with XRE-family HTH domain